MATTPQKHGREIIPIEITDEQYDMAMSIIEENTDPEWDESEWGNLFIGVTGKHQVYYTLWKYSPKVTMFENPVIYCGNLSIDIVEAAKKAKARAYRQPVYFENYETLKGLQGSRADVMTGGKYRGETIGEIYAHDPQYIIWISKNWTNLKSKKQIAQWNTAQALTEDYFRSMAERNKAAETKDYCPIGTKINEFVKIVGFKHWESDYTIKAEDDKYRFQFKLSLKNLCSALGIEYKYDLIRESGTLYEIPTGETKGNVETAVQKLAELQISGKAKYHNEIVGKKWTRLSNVRVDAIKFK